MTCSLDEVYEKFKHLDGCLSDTEWCTSGEGAAIYAIAGELWLAVKEARGDPVLRCRKEVKSFAILMESKLRKNDHKEHWTKCNQEYLLTRLDEEVKELHECFFIYSPGDMNFLMDGQHEDQIPGEAADVANFAMMLWDNFGEKESLRLAQPEPKEREPE